MMRRLSMPGTKPPRADALERRTLLSVSLAADANTVAISNGGPRDLVDLNGTLLFTHDDGRHGRELFISDGTEAGTKLLIDLYPGLLGSDPANLFAHGDKVLFSAIDEIAGRELWATDGTSAGTRRLVDLWAGGSSAPFGFTPLPDGDVVFFARNGTITSDYQLWRTDGTPEGTRLLATPRNNFGSVPREPLVFAGAVYFALGGSSSGSEIWRTDGTAAGTQRVQTVASGAGGVSGAFELAIVNDQLFFTDGLHRIYRTDGSINGAIQLANISNNTAVITEFVAAGDHVFFAARDSGGVELWAADATHAYRVEDIYAGSFGSYPTYLTAFNDVLYFSASDTSNGYELWRSDGTADGTWMARSFAAGGLSSNPVNLVEAGGKLWFSTSSTNVSPGIYVCDSAGTRRVSAISSSSPAADAAYGFAASGDHLFFGAGDSSKGVELWKTSATAPAVSNTQRVRDLYPATSGSNPRVLGTINNRVIYYADNKTNGREPWVSDGTPGGSFLLQDINPGLTGSTSNYAGGIATNGYVFFTANVDASTQLWRTNGTSGGTALVRAFSGPLEGWNTAGERVLFLYQNELWSSDGTAAGTRLLAPILFYGGATIDGVCFGAAYGTELDQELWRTDGTVAGTYRVSDLNPQGSSWPRALTAVGDQLFFFARSANTSNTALYRYSTSTQVVSLVADLFPGVPDDGHRAYGATADRFYFTNPFSDGLYVSDGTEPGTRLVTEMFPGTNSTEVTQITPLGDLVVFTVGTGNGIQLWRSDGTEAGTYALSSSLRPERSSQIGQSTLRRFQGALYFDATANGYPGVWRTDGTVAGTIMVASMNPGATNISAQFAATANRFFFTADDFQSGHELWSYTPDAPPFVALGGAFDPDAIGGEVRLTLNRAASLDFQRARPTLINRATGAAITGVALRFEPGASADEVRIVFSGPLVVLPDGDYRLSIPAGAFTDAALNPLATDFSVDFHILAGDLNRDRAVNFDDLLILAQNYGSLGRTFSQGNCDSSADGSVDFDDLLLLAQRYGTSLASSTPVPYRSKRRLADEML